MIRKLAGARTRWQEELLTVVATAKQKGGVKVLGTGPGGAGAGNLAKVMELLSQAGATEGADGEPITFQMQGGEGDSQQVFVLRMGDGGEIHIGGR